MQPTMTMWFPLDTFIAVTIATQSYDGCHIPPVTADENFNLSINCHRSWFFFPIAKYPKDVTSISMEPVNNLNRELLMSVCPHRIYKVSSSFTAAIFHAVTLTHSSQWCNIRSQSAIAAEEKHESSCLCQCFPSYQNPQERVYCCPLAPLSNSCSHPSVSYVILPQINMGHECSTSSRPPAVVRGGLSRWLHCATCDALFLFNLFQKQRKIWAFLNTYLYIWPQ